MSKASRARSKDRRKKQRHAKKEAKKKLYKQYAEQGKQKGSVRSKRKVIGERKVKKVHHPLPFCGNISCKRCFPELHSRLEEKKNASR